MNKSTCKIIAGVVAAWSIQGSAADSSMLTYDDIAIGYFWSKRPIEHVSSLSGFAVDGSWSPARNWFISLGHEDVRAHTVGLAETVQIHGQSFVATAGRWFELTPHLHVTMELGADLESQTLRSGDRHAKQSALAGDAVSTLRWSPRDRIELSASLQRLQSFGSSEDSRWVYIAGAALKLTGGLDIGGQVSREDAANSYIVALRYRF